MGVKSLLTRLVGVAVCASALLRTDLAVAYGKGSGFPKTPISPLGITGSFAMANLERLPPKAQAVTKRLLTAMAIPGEFAIEQGVLPAPKRKKSSKRPEPKTLEGKALEWLKRLKASTGMKELLKENTFAVAGALVILASSLLALFWPYECMQNFLLGIGFFWLGVNGALGDDATFTPAFYVTIVILVLSLYFLAEEDPRRAEKEAEAAAKKELEAKEKQETEDEWNDGIGGVSAETIRKRNAAECKDDCCS
ncbi:Hypothetical Protein FCC1311_027562 [Hondaea fermentalgiana]|uniref:Uncharacterized protein n=1 Tax=Hondaea fermentalgiana TaxID=2315210 RepID=A0A2R5G7L9_9STRA|nr:Hypothetical Protein FCC1311_027562 [Hondaea fermentalgiana]|eukprot:GBG26535.1 Hypothetical Protein FCC1311_027562 [Hondaea fermentalgiana]